MGFFDLNIPYHESDRHSANAKSSLKTTRLKLVTKALELGYSGVAFNHTIKGVMSESDRCSIPLFPLSSILKLAPSLSDSVKFHRQLLNVPVSSPFRQYTRLTVIVDSPSQAAALNNGNPILKTYDIVAVKPTNQNAFEQACQNAEVDIIYIDFSDKLPFRLKQPMVKAAIERGVYFEITYSALISDVQVRRQMISNAKLLVDWTRGKNLIISSGAHSITELRGPYDVANLSSLLGLTLERAKAAISKTCRSVIENALRKKKYYKEVIKVEMLPPGGQINFHDWLKWDPISSGDGDIVLDDMEKSFSTSSNVSKAPKAIDFASVLNGLPSHGLQIKNKISIPEPPNGKNYLTLKDNEMADSVTEISELPSIISFPCTSSVNNSFNVVEEGDRAGLKDNLEGLQQLEPTERDHYDLQRHICLFNNDGTASTCPMDVDFVLKGGHLASADTPTKTKALQQTNGTANNCADEIANQYASVKKSTTSKISTLSVSGCEKSLSDTISADLLTSGIIDRVLVQTDSRTDKELQPVMAEADSRTENELQPLMAEVDSRTDTKMPSALLDVSLHEESFEREKSLEAKDSSFVLVDRSPVQKADDQITIPNEQLVKKQLASAPFDVSFLERFEDEENLQGGNISTSVDDELPIAESSQCPLEFPSGRPRAKRKASRRISLLPFKRLSSPGRFKKKSRKFRL